MSDDREFPILDLMTGDVHVTRINGPGPVCYRVEQGKQKVTLAIQDIYTIFGGIRGDYEYWLHQKRVEKREP